MPLHLIPAAMMAAQLSGGRCWFAQDAKPGQTQQVVWTYICVAECWVVFIYLNSCHVQHTCDLVLELTRNIQNTYCWNTIDSNYYCSEHVFGMYATVEET